MPKADQDRTRTPDAPPLEKTALGRVVEPSPAPNHQHLCGGMLKAETNSTPSRRHVLAALSGAALAGGALVLAMPTEAPATISNSATVGADTELLTLCARYHAAADELRSGSIVDQDAEDDLALEVYDMLDAISTTEAATPAGERARASVACKEMKARVHVLLNRSWREDAHPAELLAINVLAGVAGRT